MTDPPALSPLVAPYLPGLPKRLAQARQALDLSQARLSKAFEERGFLIKTRAIRAYEIGQHRPPAEYIIALYELGRRSRQAKSLRWIVLGETERGRDDEEVTGVDALGRVLRAPAR